MSAYLMTASWFCLKKGPRIAGSRHNHWHGDAHLYGFSYWRMIVCPRRLISKGVGLLGQSSDWNSFRANSTIWFWRYISVLSRAIEKCVTRSSSPKSSNWLEGQLRRAARRNTWYVVCVPFPPGWTDELANPNPGELWDFVLWRAEWMICTINS